MTAPPSPSMTPHQSPETLNFPRAMPPHPHTTEQISPIAMSQQHQSFSGTHQTANSPVAPIPTPTTHPIPSAQERDSPEHLITHHQSPLTLLTLPTPLYLPMPGYLLTGDRVVPHPCPRMKQ